MKVESSKIKHSMERGAKFSPRELLEFGHLPLFPKGRPPMQFCPYCQLPLQGAVATCPSCYADLSAVSGAPPVLPPRAGGTLVESVQELREQIHQMNKPGGGTVHEPVPAAKPGRSAPPRPAEPAAAPPGQAGDDTVTYRPLHRMPTLRLCILDDGSRDQGEWIRVRRPSFVIGRVDGDLVLPHDNDLSGRHVEFQARVVDGQYRFFVRDLQSTNGTFLRVARLLLKKDQELLIGAKRYRFDPGSLEQIQQPPQFEAAATTRGWQAVNPQALQTLYPALVEMTPAGPGRRYEIRADDQLLGRNGQRCTICISDDPFVSPIHARIQRDPKGRWQMENQGSLNGIWLRVAEAPLDADTEVQIGDQRILVRLPPRF